MIYPSSYASLYKDVRNAVDLCHRDGTLKQKVATDPRRYRRNITSYIVFGWGEMEGGDYFKYLLFGLFIWRGEKMGHKIVKGCKSKLVFFHPPLTTSPSPSSPVIQKR